MKQKSHSGLKKRLKIRKSGAVFVKKPGKNHLLSNKSKRQKKLYRSGMPADITRFKAFRRLLPGIVVLDHAKKKAVVSGAGEKDAGAKVKSDN
ncbi:50S ribosomal protein L35 [Candidatus Peregrinibacteria bacterium]|nr:50S ribosomal protein L35 [Candidatus Peregrinibacteria bacterium]